MIPPDIDVFDFRLELTPENDVLNKVSIP